MNWIEWCVILLVVFLLVQDLKAIEKKHKELIEKIDSFSKKNKSHLAVIYDAIEKSRLELDEVKQAIDEMTPKTLLRSLSK